MYSPHLYVLRGALVGLSTGIVAGLFGGAPRYTETPCLESSVRTTSRLDQVVDPSVACPFGGVASGACVGGLLWKRKEREMKHRNEKIKTFLLLPWPESYQIVDESADRFRLYDFPRHSEKNRDIS